jgi:hypothetical protein
LHHGPAQARTRIPPRDADPAWNAPGTLAELPSTAGPVEHVKTGCVNNHWLTPLATAVQAARPAAHAPSAPAELAVSQRG